MAGSSILDSDGEEEGSFQPSVMPSSSQPPSPLSPSPSPSPFPSPSPSSQAPSHPLLAPTSCCEQESACTAVPPFCAVASPPGEEESGPASQPEPDKQRKPRVVQLSGKRKFRYVPDELPDVPLPKLAVQKTRSLPPRPLRITRPSLLLEPKRLRICKPSEDLRLTIVANRVCQTSVIPSRSSSPPGLGERGKGGGGGGSGRRGGGGCELPSTVNTLLPSASVPPSQPTATSSHTTTCSSSSLPLAKPGGTLRLFNKSPSFFANGLTLSMYTKLPTSQPSPSPSPPSLPPPSTSPSSHESSKDDLVNPFLSQIPNHQELLNPFVSALSEHKQDRARSVSSHWNGCSLTTPNQHLSDQQRVHQCRDGLFSQLSCPSPPRQFSFSLSQLTN